MSKTIISTKICKEIYDYKQIFRKKRIMISIQSLKKLILNLCNSNCLILYNSIENAIDVCSNNKGINPQQNILKFNLLKSVIVG